ncbi:tetratricopeptide repeat protein [Falsihalocynthiibacter sp. SS001]|uniref:tetratricopeptide repeat protein n=1 Tax=Falsihalocynthiibacter sp. SS001 TaxID=3349698 RepID=UPI0036D2FE17
MRHPFFLSLCLCSAITLSACGDSSDTADVERAVKDLNVIDESNLNDIMLTVADPDEGVAYYKKAVLNEPNRIDFKRGLALSLVRAKKPEESLSSWKAVVESSQGTSDDRVNYADALIRSNKWDEAETMLDSVPPTVETFKRYRLEAMIADSNKDWDKADSYYETAVGLTTKPANVLNNWGYSMLTRGNYEKAEKLFGDAISYDSKLFTAKNNLVLARGAQRNYEIPIVPMTQEERAQLLHTMALSAIKQGDVATGKGLLKDAIETHPQHFESAVRSLSALEGGA